MCFSVLYVWYLLADRMHGKFLSCSRVMSFGYFCQVGTDRSSLKFGLYVVLIIAAVYISILTVELSSSSFSLLLVLCLKDPSTPMQVAVFVQGVDTSTTETKGTVLIHSAEQVTHWNCSACTEDVNFSLL